MVTGGLKHETAHVLAGGRWHRHPEKLPRILSTGLGIELASLWPSTGAWGRGELEVGRKSFFNLASCPGHYECFDFLPFWADDGPNLKLT